MNIEVIRKNWMSTLIGVLAMLVVIGQGTGLVTPEVLEQWHVTGETINLILVGMLGITVKDGNKTSEDVGLCTKSEG